jgi:hypothetical protein
MQYRLELHSHIIVSKPVDERVSFLWHMAIFQIATRLNNKNG